MTFQDLINDLDYCTMSILPKTENQDTFYQVQFYFGYEKNLSKNTIYMCKLSDMARLEHIPAIDAIILVDTDDASVLDRISRQLSGGATITDPEEFRKCYDSLNQIFASLYNLSLNLQELSRIIYGNRNLQHIVNHIAKMFDHPVNIVDSSFSVLTSSTNYEFFNEELKADNEKGHVPPEILKQVDLTTQRRGKGLHEPILLKNPKWGFMHYLTPIVNNNFVIGYYSIYLHPDESLSSAEYSFLGLVAAQIGTYMQKKDFYLSSRSNYYTALLSSVLNENTQLSADTERRFSAFGYTLKKEKYIFITQIVGELPKRVSLLGLCSILQKIITNSIYTIQNGEIIFLASFDQNSDDMEQIQDILHDRAEEFSYIKIGTSAPFYKLSDAREHWHQARSAIETGSNYNPKEFFFMYDQYRLMHMIYVLNQSTDVSRFLLPQMKLLINYDNKNHTELLYTLFIYVHFVKNPSKACNILHIHRNTLYARIEKIRELTGFNLENMASITMILVSFAILRLQNTITWEVHDLM